MNKITIAHENAQPYVIIIMIFYNIEDHTQKFKHFWEEYFFTQIVTKHGFVLTPSFLYYMMKCSTEAEKIEYVKMS